MQQEGQRGSNWLLQGFLFVCLFEMVSEWSMAGNKTYQLAAISTAPKIHYFLKAPLRRYAHFLWETIDPESPCLSHDWGRMKKYASQDIPATKGKPERVIEASKRMKMGKGRQRPPEPPLFGPGPSLLTWIFIAWGCAHPSTIMITAKSHSKWKTLDEAHLLLHKSGMVQWLDHCHDQSDLNDPLFISSPEETPFDPESRELFFISFPLITVGH